MEWFDPTAGVVLMHPAQVKDGMRLAREVVSPEGVPTTELTPVWDSGYSNGAWFRTSDSKLHTFYSDPYGNGASFVWVQPEILTESMPPYEGRWLTNQKFDERAGMVGDRYFYERTTAVDEWICPDSRRVYRLLHGRSRRREDTGPGERWSCFWVYRWDHGVKWIGPSREQHRLAEEQFDKIRGGQAW